MGRQLSSYGEKFGRISWEYRFPDPLNGEVCIRTLIDSRTRYPAQLIVSNSALEIGNTIDPSATPVCAWLTSLCKNRVVHVKSIPSALHREFDLHYHFIFDQNEEPLLIPGDNGDGDSLINLCIAEIPLPEGKGFTPPNYWGATEITGNPRYSFFGIAKYGVPKHAA